MTAPVGSSTERGRLDLNAGHIHFVGIGGCGMSGLARIAQQQGATCTGTDLAAGPLVDRLKADGISIELQQAAHTVPDDCDLLVVSAAIGADHPEVAEARRRGITVLKYAQMLGKLLAGRTGVAIAGTHGKSTTTSMLAHLLIQAGLDPSFIVGANCHQIGGGSRAGSGGTEHGDILVVEACEFDRSFHELQPRHAVILNVEADHLDVYGSLDEIVEAFAVFARKLPPGSSLGPPTAAAHQTPEGGTLLINQEMPHRLAITAGLRCVVETLGFSSQSDWRIEVSSPPPPGGPERSGPAVAVDCPGSRVYLYHRGKRVAEWLSPLPGDHMAYNAAAAAITAWRLGSSWSQIAAGLACFEGLDRRMQYLGRRPIEGGCVTIVDDYGHHPTEIDTTLRALRQHYRPRRLICVFQPHQHSRTRFLMDQFAASFSEADIVIVPQIYFVRDSEMERHAVTAADLVDRLRHKQVQAMHLDPFDAIVEQLEVASRPGDLLVTMGAGDVWQVARNFLGR